MAHRRILTAGQRRALFGLPDDEEEYRRRYTLDHDDLRRIRRRRKPGNRLGFALQLCAPRFPGRLLRPGEAIPEAMLRVIADQIDADWHDIAGYGLRENTGVTSTPPPCSRSWATARSWGRRAPIWSAGWPAPRS